MRRYPHRKDSAMFTSLISTCTSYTWRSDCWVPLNLLPGRRKEDVILEGIWVGVPCQRRPKTAVLESLRPTLCLSFVVVCGCTEGEVDSSARDIDCASLASLSPAASGNGAGPDVSTPLSSSKIPSSSSFSCVSGDGPVPAVLTPSCASSRCACCALRALSRFCCSTRCGGRIM